MRCALGVFFCLRFGDPTRARSTLCRARSWTARWTETQLPSPKLNASRRGSGGTFDATPLAAFATNLRTPLMGSDQPLDSDILVPADVDGDLIEWDGNDGHLNGILHEVGKYFQRKTLFKPLFENRAVVVKGGKRE